MKIFQILKKQPFDVLVFHDTFQVCCVYNLNCGLNRSIHEMCDYDQGNLFEYWQRQSHIDLKEKKSVLLVYSFKSFLYQKIKSFSTVFPYTDLYIWWVLTKESFLWR